MTVDIIPINRTDQAKEQAMKLAHDFRHLGMSAHVREARRPNVGKPLYHDTQDGLSLYFYRGTMPRPLGKRCTECPWMLQEHLFDTSMTLFVFDPETKDYLQSATISREGEKDDPFFAAHYAGMRTNSETNETLTEFADRVYHLITDILPDNHTKLPESQTRSMGLFS